MIPVAAFRKYEGLKEQPYLLPLSGRDHSQQEQEESVLLIRLRAAKDSGRKDGT